MAGVQTTLSDHLDGDVWSALLRLYERRVTQAGCDDSQWAAKNDLISFKARCQQFASSWLDAQPTRERFCDFSNQAFNSLLRFRFGIPILTGGPLLGPRRHRRSAPMAWSGTMVPLRGIFVIVV